MTTEYEMEMDRFFTEMHLAFKIALGVICGTVGFALGYLVGRKVPQ